MKHLTDFERQFIAKAAFDWYTQHGYSCSLYYSHGNGQYDLFISVHDGKSLPSFPFLDHADIFKVTTQPNDEVETIHFAIPYGRL